MMTATTPNCLPLVLALVLACGEAFADDAPRPNILWITCEDSSPNLHCYGDGYAVTPNLDRLANEGVRYTRAFSVAGVCAPSRSCLITGMYPSTIGSQHMRSTTRLPEGIKCFTEYLREAGYYCSNHSKEDYNFKTPRSAWDESSTKAHWRKRQPGQPFFAVFNFTTTHESQIRLGEAAFAKRTAGLADSERHDPAAAPVPRYHPDTGVVRRDWAHYYDLITVMDKQAGELLAALDADGLADDTIVFFFSDHGVGLPRGKRWLYDSGLHVPLVIRFPPRWRHFAAGEPGADCDRLVSFVDFAPTVLSLAGVAPPEHLQGVAFLGEQAGPPREYVYGIRDRMDERYDLSRAVRDRRWKYIHNYRPELPYAQPIEYMEEMPTMRQWRQLAAEGMLDGPAALFMQPIKAIEELYDTQADPDEVNNLALADEHRDVLERMRAAHLEWVRETRDLGFLPEAEMWRRVGDGAPYELGRDSKGYPQGRILAAAQRTNVEARQLAGLLVDGDAAVRWWTLVRLSPTANSLADCLPVLERALMDDSPSVRFVAADVLCRAGEPARGLPVLARGLSAREPYVRLAAANRLDWLGDRAAPVRDAMRKAASDSNGDVQKVLRHALR